MSKAFKTQETNLLIQCDLEKTYHSIMNQLPIYHISFSRQNNKIPLKRSSIMKIINIIGITPFDFINLITIYQTQIEQVVVYKKIKALSANDNNTKSYNNIKVNLLVNLTSANDFPRIHFNEVNIFIEETKDNLLSLTSTLSDSSNEYIEVIDSFCNKPCLVKLNLLKENLKKDNNTQYIYINDILNQNIRIEVSKFNMSYLTNDCKLWIYLYDIKGQEVIINKQKYLLNTKYTNNSIMIIKDYYNVHHEIKNPNYKGPISTIAKDFKQKINYNPKIALSNYINQKNKSTFSPNQTRQSDTFDDLNKECFKGFNKTKREDTWISVKDIIKEKILIKHSIVEKYIKAIIDKKENSFSEKEEVSDVNNKKKIIQPWKVVLAYLRKYYLEKIHPKEEPIIEVCNKEESIRHLISMTQLEQVQSSDEEITLLDIECEMFSVTRSDLDRSLHNKWVLIEMNDANLNYFIREKDLFQILKTDSFIQDVNIVNIFPKDKRNFYPPYFLANKYMNNKEDQGQQGIESSYVNTLQTISDIITTEDVLQTIESIHEKENFEIEIFIKVFDVENYLHLVNIKEIKPFENNAKIINLKDINGLLFYASSDSCGDINIHNELNHIFCLKNIYNNNCYIQKIEAIELINLILYNMDAISNEEHLFDINHTIQVILFNEVLNLIGATKLGECLQSPIDDNGDIELSRLKESNIMIPRHEILSLLNRIYNKEKLTNYEEIITSQGKLCYINPFTLRKTKHNSIKKQIFPYIFIDKTNSYFEISNRITYQKKLFQASSILELIHTKELPDEFNRYELKLSLNEQNKSNEYIFIKDMNNNECFIKKDCIIQLIKDLMNNNEINDIKSIKDYEGEYHSIQVKTFIQENFMPVPSPYIKDNLLKNDHLTYYYIKKEMIPKERMSNIMSHPGNELIEYILLEDIQKNPCYILKPFIRACLLENNRYEKIKVIDLYKLIHVIRLDQLDIKPTNSHKTIKCDNTIPSNFLYIDIYDYERKVHFISLDKLNSCTLLAKSNQSSLEDIIVIDSNGIKKSLSNLIIPDDYQKRKKWVRVPDINQKDIYIYQSVINTILTNHHNKKINEERLVVMDYNCHQHVIICQQIINIILMPKENQDIEIEKKEETPHKGKKMYSLMIEKMIQ